MTSTESRPVVLSVIDHKNNLDNDYNGSSLVHDSNWMKFFNITLSRRDILNDVLIICGKTVIKRL